MIIPDAGYKIISRTVECSLLSAQPWGVRVGHSQYHLAIAGGCGASIRVFSTVRGSGWPRLKLRESVLFLLGLSLGHPLPRTVLNTTAREVVLTVTHANAEVAQRIR